MEQRREARRTVRRLLWRWGQVNETCLRWTRDLEEKRRDLQAVTDIKSPKLSGMPHGGGISDRTAQAAEKLDALEKIFEETIEQATSAIEEELRFQRAMDDAVSTLPSSQRWVLELRYKSEYSYERIARKTNYSSEYVKSLESKACDKLAERVDIKR